MGGDPVSLAPAVEQHPQGGAHERMARTQRRLALGPGVAEGVVAVADVNGARIHEHAVAQALEEEITVSYPRRSNDSIACG